MATKLLKLSAAVKRIEKDVQDLAGDRESSSNGSLQHKPKAEA